MQSAETPNYPVGGVIVIGLLLLAMFGFVLYIVGETPKESYSDTNLDICYSFTKHFDDLYAVDCARYLETNPGATGQEILDHYSIRTLDELLVEPLTVHDIDSDDYDDGKTVYLDYRSRCDSC